MRITVPTYRPTVTAALSAATYSLLPVTYTLNYAFSAKERDVETGLSYFGARYYSSDLSIWLSVDPMSDKYPSLSPYVYCADNPVRCVDPNGDSVVFKLGINYNDKDIDDAVNDMRNAAPNLNLTRNGNTLTIGEGGVAKTKYEKQLYEAIISTEFKSEITLDYNSGRPGSYYGTDLKDGIYVSDNKVNPSQMSKWETNHGAVRGCGLIHEITEGYEMGKIAKEQNRTHISGAYNNPGTKTLGAGFGERPFQTDNPINEVDYNLYLMGHRRATPAPENTWYSTPLRYFK